MITVLITIRRVVTRKKNIITRNVYARDKTENKYFPRGRRRVRGWGRFVVKCAPQHRQIRPSTHGHVITFLVFHSRNARLMQVSILKARSANTRSQIISGAPNENGKILKFIIIIIFAPLFVPVLLNGSSLTHATMLAFLYTRTTRTLTRSGVIEFVLDDVIIQQIHVTSHLNLFISVQHHVRQISPGLPTDSSDLYAYTV